MGIQIKVQPFIANNYELWRQANCNPLPSQGLNCEGQESQGQMWAVPITRNGAVDAYEFTYEDASTTAGAFKVVKTRNLISGDTMIILGDETEFLTKCNACCGSLPEMTVITIPAADLDEEACCRTEITESDCIYELTGSVGAIPAGAKITLSGSANGVAFTPAAPAAGFATYALANTWINANWGAYGSSVLLKDPEDGVTDVGILFTAINKTGSFSVVLDNEPYCLTIVAAETFNEVVHNGVTYPLGKVVTVANAAQVIPEISGFFADGTLTEFSATKINYLGIGIPGGLYLNGVAVRSFVAGACA
jgi:hypothetical protein